eukprot:TRINITY_DN611_c0_g1_i1.p1 TRINITY_DN611_c0_g1~~TRINITY_DN611_c0_g1_i1.p1  ORF type:complete len:142 (+),score=47.41 TRINITY_DN611_c0_g1_i1:76-501(+)
MAANEENLVRDFQSVTGHDDATSRAFLSRVNWNLERALSDYFDNNVPPPVVLKGQIPAGPAVSIVPNETKARMSELCLVYTEEANVFFKNHQWEYARFSLDRAIELLNDCSYLYERRAETCSKLELWEQAAEDRERANACY